MGQRGLAQEPSRPGTCCFVEPGWLIYLILSLPVGTKVTFSHISLSISLDTRDQPDSVEETLALESQHLVEDEDADSIPSSQTQATQSINPMLRLSQQSQMRGKTSAQRRKRARVKLEEDEEL